MEVETQLTAEIKKWDTKIREERKKIVVKETRATDLLKNIDAYIADSKHFFEKGDMIRSFEAIVWAWSWLEILKELEIIQ